MSKKQENKPAKMGRPTLWTDRMGERILELAAAGKTEAEIAKACRINISTLRLWKSQNPDFSTALKEAKDVADDLVEISLFRKATGYKHRATKFFCHEGAVIREDYTEVYAPDTTAAIFWLKNRRPERWRDVQKIDVNATHKVTAMTREEAIKALATDYATLPPKDEVKTEDIDG